MALYFNQNGKLKEVKEKTFKLEKDIQRLFEANLQEIMGLELVKSEFSIKNKRIDTLAYDKQSNAFSIIEYKRDKNSSVVDQGFAYLSLKLENKADFIVEYNESTKSSLKREEVDWSQTRVSFVSTSFTENQIQSTNFKDLGIELWEVKQYENNTVTINQIKKSASAESIKPISQKNEAFKNISGEIKVYTEQDHLKNTSEFIAELYENYKTAILNLSSGIEVVPKKHYLAFKKGGNITDIVPQKKSLKIFINTRIGELNDPKNITQDVSNVGHWGNGDYQIIVEDDRDLEYIMSLIKQVIH
jgi:predicted transport protein